MAGSILDCVFISTRSVSGRLLEARTVLAIIIKIISCMTVDLLVAEA